MILRSSFFFFFNDTATTEIYTLSLHDALPILKTAIPMGKNVVVIGTQWGDEGKGKIVDWLTEHAQGVVRFQGGHNADRKSTRLNSSHANISYAVFCLKKKKNKATDGTVLPTSS